MIKSIHLQNFQSHKDTIIDFDEGVNAIVGLSDSGKTAIFRAIKWVLMNRPSGESFRSHWGGDTKVSIEFNNEVCVTRVRTDSDNYYVLSIPNNTKTFRAFGQDVPEEIRNAVNISDINMAYQMGTPFLLSASPGEVAQTLNEVVDLDDIDRSISSIIKSRKEVESELKHHSKQLKDIDEQIKSYDYLAEMESSVLEYEHLQKLENATTAKMNTLYGIVNTAYELEWEFNKSNMLCGAENMVTECLALQDLIKDINDNIFELEDLIKDIDFFSEEQEKNKRILSAEKEVNACENKINANYKLEKNMISIENLIRQYEWTEQEMLEACSEQQSLEREFARIMPKLCPLCGQETTNVTQTEKTKTPKNRC